MAGGVYYNENDPKAAAWLRNLIALGAIAGGDVDERSIVDVKADDLKGYTHVHFFAGVGGWAYALELAGWPRDREVWTGSCPCQPFSVIGTAEGLGDERHLWPAFHRLIAERHPSKVLGEQVASKDGRYWLSGIRVDLEQLGYAVGAADLCAAGVGAPNIRQRLFWVADADTDRLGDALEPGLEGHRRHVGDRDQSGRLGAIARRSAAAAGLSGFWSEFDVLPFTDSRARRVEPGSFPLAHGIPADLGRGRAGIERMAIRAARAFRTTAIRGYGNAINPEIAADFIMATA